MDVFVAAVGVVEVGELCQAGEERAWVGGEGVEVEEEEGFEEGVEEEEG